MCSSDLETDDLRGNAALDDRLPPEMPDPQFPSEGEGITWISWCRIRYNEEGVPQLWMDIRDTDGLCTLLIYRSYADENNQKKSELYSWDNLEGHTQVVRYRTLTKPGSYVIVTSDANGETQNFGTVITLEDVDNNGIADTMTNHENKVTLLEIENAFSSSGKNGK